MHALREAAAHLHVRQPRQSLVEVAESVEPAELRRLLSVLIIQDHPEAPDEEHQDQRDKRGLSLSETANGMFRLDGWLDGLEGRRLRDAPGPAFTDRTSSGDTPPPPRPAPMRWPTSSPPANANTRPLEVSGLSVLVDLENLPTASAPPRRRAPSPGPATFDLLSCATACAVIFGVKRDTPSCRWRWAAHCAGIPLAMGRTDRPRPRLHPLRPLSEVLPGPPHRALENGGLTDLSRISSSCSRCHHDLHNGHYTITMQPNGVPTITNPRTTPTGGMRRSFEYRPGSS